MPITKQYGKGAAVVRHNNALDTSTKDNTAAGASLGATPELDRGWSYPPAGDSLPFWGTGGRFRAFFPTPQQPTFRNTDTVIKRPTDDFSEKMSFNIIYPWVSSSSGARSGRCETYTNHASQKEEYTCIRMSVYRPVGDAVDPRRGHIFYQVHNGSGSPSLSLIESRGGFIEFRVYGGGSGSQNTTGIFIGTLTRGVWHEFTIFTRWIFGADSSAQGYHLCFYGNKIARSFLKSGSVPTETIAPGQTPRQTGTSGQSQWALNTELLGNLPLQVTESGTIRDLLFFKGRTMADPAYSTLYPKWGIYKSTWGSNSDGNHYNNDDTINTLLDGGASWENAVLSNPDNPGITNTYAPPELRTGTIHTSCALGNVGVGETHEYMFEQLNDGLKIDSADRALIASEPELSWFTLNVTAETYSLTVQTSTGGTVTGTSGSYSAGTVVAVTATSSSGYTFARWRNVNTNETVSFTSNFNFTVPSFDVIIEATFNLITVPPPGGRLRGKLKKSNSVIVTPPTIPTDPYLVSAGGWAGLYNGGLGVTGGTGGTLRVYTDPVLMLTDLIASSASIPEIYYYTGVNASIGQARRTITGKSNKTLMCSTGQSILDGEIRFESCQNIIIRNIKREGLTLAHEDVSNIDGDTKDGFTINSCTGVWVDHVHITSNGVYSGVSPNTGLYWDGCIDMNISNYVTISNSIFENTHRGILYGYAPTGSSATAVGFGVTVRNCIMYNLKERAPRVRFANFGLHQCLIGWSPAWLPTQPNRPGDAYTIGVGEKAQIWSECNYYISGDRLVSEYDTDIIKESGSISVNDFIGPYVRQTTFLRPENVEWNPNIISGYNLIPEIITPELAKTYCETWAGAKYHLKYPIT